MRLNIGLVVLSILMWTSALGVVYTKHETRQLFTRLQILQNERDALHTERTQLLLEQGTWAAYSRVEKIARETLGMETPLSGDVRVIDARETQDLVERDSQRTPG